MPMPKFLKDNTIVLLDGGVQSYMLALHGMVVPVLRTPRKAETKYAPVVGLYGAAAELLAKACLVQAKGNAAMYKNGDVAAGIYRFDTEVIEELRKSLRDDDPCISYIWSNANEHSEQKEHLLHCLNKFKLLQELRANGLHAGLGCSRDIAVATATDVHNFIQLLSQSKKLRPYLRNIPAPEATIRDREAIIEDLSRRLSSAKCTTDKVAYLRNMYLVLPYIPEMKPDWVDAFDRIAVAPPTEGDLSYLVKTLSDAHSIYLLKTRGGKDGIPVRVEPQNPEALPIAIQNIKRTLSTTPDKFYNDVLTANTRLDENRLDLPPEDFLVDLYAIGLRESGVITDLTPSLTAQQVWPFLAAAYSTNGTPRPCWFIVRECSDIGQLISYMQRAGKCGNGYLKRRIPEVLSSLQALKDNASVCLGEAKDQIFREIFPYKLKNENPSEENKTPFNPSYLRRYPTSEKASALVHEFVVGNSNAGNTLASLLELDKLEANDKKAAIALLNICYGDENKNGLISVLRTDNLSGYISVARKNMFFADFIENGPALR
jgi:hypothetical protein